MNTRNWYYLQPVTEAELDAAFADVHTAVKNLFVDHPGGLDAGRYPTDGKRFGGGVVKGLEVFETSPLSINVKVQPGVAYDKQGRRMAVLTEQTVSLATDENGVSTMPSAGKYRMVGLFLQYAQATSDPRTDGNGNTVYFQVADSYTFKVRMSAEYTNDYDLTRDTRPWHATDILLGEWLRNDSYTTVSDPWFFSDRRENLVDGGRLWLAEGAAAGFQLLAEWATQWGPTSWGSAYNMPALRLYSMTGYGGFILTSNAYWDEFRDYDPNPATGGGWRRDNVHESAMAIRFDSSNEIIQFCAWSWYGIDTPAIQDWDWPYTFDLDYYIDIPGYYGQNVRLTRDKLLFELRSSTVLDVGEVHVRQMSDATPNVIVFSVPLQACYYAGSVSLVNVTQANVASVTWIASDPAKGYMWGYITPTAGTTWTYYAATVRLTR